MAFTVEDGTGVANAPTHTRRPAQVTDYLTDRGRQTENGWSSAEEAAQNAAIIQATDFIEKRFAGLWRGTRGSEEQGLSWPSSGVTTGDGVTISATSLPRLLIEAVAEYTVRALISACTLLRPDRRRLPVRVAWSRSQFTKVGEIETRTRYSDPAGAGTAVVTSTVPSYPAADLLIQPLLNRSLVPGGDRFGASGEAVMGIDYQALARLVVQQVQRFGRQVDLLDESARPDKPTLDLGSPGNQVATGGSESRRIRRARR